MSEQEILDIVNENDEVIGSAPRAECHSNPNLIHRVVHCWLINADGQFLWQQRSKLKKQSPGKWDMSCGGHILSGAQPYEELVRELEEELGVKDIELTFIERYIIGNESQTEMVHLFLGYCDLKESNFTLQKEEVEKVKWFDYHDALSKFINKELESTDFVFNQLSRIYQYLAKTHLNKAYWILPTQIKEVGFDFRWDEKKVWGLALPVEEMPIEELTWHFEIPFWFTKHGFYDLKPAEVLSNPNRYSQKYQRIINTDTSYPIDIMFYKGRYVILDGLHRLAKLAISKALTVKVRKVEESMIPLIEK